MICMTETVIVLHSADTKETCEVSSSACVTTENITQCIRSEEGICVGKTMCLKAEMGQ